MPRKKNTSDKWENGEYSEEATVFVEPTEFTDGDFVYKVTASAANGAVGTVEVKKYNGSDLSVEVPVQVTFEETFTYKVTEIGDNAFDGNDKITSVILPNQITRIGVRAFADCPNLATMSTVGD